MIDRIGFLCFEVQVDFKELINIIEIIYSSGSPCPEDTSAAFLGNPPKVQVNGIF